MKNMNQFNQILKKSLLSMVISLSLGLGQAYAAGSSIAAINLNYILSNAKIAQNASQKMEREYNSRSEQLKPIVAKLDALSEKLAAAQKNKATESAEFKKNEEEFLKLREEFQKKEAQMSEEFGTVKAAEDKKVLQEIDAVVKTVAAQEKVDIVIVSPIYANSNADMTMKVLNILNK